MAYPDYSIVIISVTTNGVTVDYANSFYNEKLAKEFYKQAISEGKRAFYFEKPSPSKFTRNDVQPFKINTEEGAENAPIQSMEEAEQEDLGELAEQVYRNAEKTFTDAVGTVRTYQKFQIEVAKRFFDIFYVGSFKFFKKVFNRVVNEPAEVVVAIEIITNKKITIKHDGNGGFNIEVEKLYPDKYETLLVDAGNIIFDIAIENSPVVLGVKKLKKTFGGLSAEDFTTEELFEYLSALTIVLETDTKIYRANGTGGVTVENKNDGGGGGEDDDDNNPAEGTNLGPDSNDPCFDLIADGNGSSTQQSNGSCDNPTEGTNLGTDPSDPCFDLIANGMGGSTQESNGSCDNPAEGTNLGVDPSDPCYDLIANGTGGSTSVNNGSCDAPAEGTNLGTDPSDPCYDLIADGDGGSTQQSNGSCDGGGGGEEGTEETLVDPEHETNGQFSDTVIDANWDGGHPYNAEGELHMVTLDSESGLWVYDPAV